MLFALMLFAAEIALTVVAWQKGWKALALLPIGAAYFAGSMVAASTVASGGNPYAALATGYMIDVICIITLACMASTPPNTIRR